jgi:hypothetical protein
MKLPNPNQNRGSNDFDEKSARRPYDTVAYRGYLRAEDSDSDNLLKPNYTSTVALCTDDMCEF